MKQIIAISSLMITLLSSTCFAQTFAVYDDAAGIAVNTSSFANRLSSAEDDVQDAFNRIDDILVVNASNCQGLTSGRSGDLCIQDDTGNIYRCDPSAGACDTAGEWKAVNTDGNAATATLATTATTANNLGPDGVDALTEIAQSIKTAANDTSPLVVGTAGSTNEIAKWDANGNLVDANAIIGTLTDGRYCRYTSAGTLIDCDRTCVDITGSAALCDGSDDGAAGGSSLVTQVNSVTQSTATGTFNFQTTNTWLKVTEPTANIFVVTTKNTFTGNLSLLGTTTGTFALNAASTAVTASSNDDDTSVATTGFVQQEINGAGGPGLTCSSGVCSPTLGTSIDISSESNLVAGTNITLAGDTLNVDDVFVLTAGDTMSGYLYVLQTLAVGQNSIATSAILELSSTTKALLLTRVTEPSTSITTPVDGMIAYDTDNDQVEARINGAWVDLAAGGAETNNLETITTGIQTTEIPIGTAANTVVYAALSGDATMTNGGVVTVVNDLHDHTSTSISGVDISADTNLVAGDALTMAGDTINFDGGTAPGGELGGTWGTPTIDDSLTVAGWTLSAPTITGTASITGTFNITSGDLILPNNTSCTTLNPNPTNGQICVDTNATSGQQIYVGESQAWVLQGDGGGGSGDAVQVNGSAVDTTANFIDTSLFEFDITDGGAGGPDSVTGTLNFVDTPADEECVTYEATGNTWEAQSCGGGSSSDYVILSPASAFITGTIAIVGDATQGAQIDGSNGGVLLLDATTDEGFAHRFRLPDNWASHTDVKIMYSAASATSGTVEFEAAVMCQTAGDSERDDADGFAAIAVASDTVPGTVFFPDTVTITLTDDSCSSSDIMTLFISTDSDDGSNDTATGDRRVLGVIYEYGI